jgi:hypothetical protein
LQAYHWYQAASEQKFVPSKNNLGRMNLLYLLFPNEALAHIASFFTMKGLFSVGAVSSRAHWVIRSVVTRTDFLNSKCPYAVEFYSLFNNVQFEPEPKEIRLSISAKLQEGSIEVHFRDTQHLKNIVEETSLIRASDRLYFVRDSNAQDHQELIPTKGDLQEVYFINFVADVPLKVMGKINHHLVCSLHFPQGTDFNGLSFNGKGANTGDLESLTQAYALAAALDTFNDHLFKIRTADAYQLLKDRRKSRHESPSMYPDLLDLCPDACLITASNLDIIQTDYISADQPLIYISKSVEDITELQNMLPEFSASISYINPSDTQSGVYCEGPLILQKGFEVFSSGHLTIGGRMGLYDHSLKLTSKDSMWEIGVQYVIGGSIAIRSGNILYAGACFSRREANKKPDGMPEEDWQKLLTFWSQTDRIR